MAINSTSPLLFFFTLLTYFSSTTPVIAASQTDFIHTSCQATSYPDICVQSLKTYALTVRSSHRQLAHIALAVSTRRAHEASNYLSRLSSAHKGKYNLRAGGSTNSFGDCTVAMADSVNRLQKAAKELRRLVRGSNRRFALRISNIRTWVSAALTDQNTCLGSLSPDVAVGSDGTGTTIHKKVFETSQVTTNALSLVNGIGSRN